MHGRALGNRGDGRACQCVHAGTFVNTGFRIRLIPRTLRQSNDARNNSRRDLSFDVQRTSVILDQYSVARFNTSGLCVDRVDQQEVRLQLLNPRQIGIRGVDVPLTVVTVALKGVFLLKRILMASHFLTNNVRRNRQNNLTLSFRKLLFFC